VAIGIEIETNRGHRPVFPGHLANEAATEAQPTGVKASEPDQIHHLVGRAQVKLRLCV
jgi:hypothetical protein